jgi:hypothetical protein
MKKSIVAVLATTTALSVAHLAQADTLADWTFESTLPSGTGPYSPEIGSGSATAVGLGTISSPAGNGSSHSFSANGWNVGTSYYQFQVSTIGYNNLTLSYDQTSSNTGPGLFNLEYTTDGVNFFTIASGYSVLANASPNPVWNVTTSSSLYNFSYNLSSITGLNNQSVVDFLIVDASTTSANGATVAGTGTDRVDNVIVSGTVAPVPEPSTLALCALGAVGGLLRLRRKA